MTEIYITIHMAVIQVKNIIPGVTESNLLIFPEVRNRKIFKYQGKGKTSI